MHYLNGFLGTISSAGDLSLWSTTIPDKKLSLICTTKDESIRPTCIKLINTTENRYKEEVTVKAVDVEENVQQSVEKSKPLSTSCKVVIEVDSNDNDQALSTSGNWKLEISDDTDTDTEIVTTPVKKTPRKKKVTGNSNELVSTPTNSQINENTQTSSKKKKDKFIVTKPIVVRSADSDDDFEKSGQENKRRSQVTKKKKTIADNTVVKTKKRALTTTPSTEELQNKRVQNGNSKAAVKNTKKRTLSQSNMSFNGTPILKKKIKSQGKSSSSPNVTKQTSKSNNQKDKASHKLNLSGPSSGHLMSTRKKQRTTM